MLFFCYLCYTKLLYACVSQQQSMYAWLEDNNNKMPSPIRLCVSAAANGQAASHGSRSAVLLFSPLILIYIGAICSKQSFYIMPALQSAIACWVPNFLLYIPLRYFSFLFCIYVADMYVTCYASMQFVCFGLSQTIPTLLDLKNLYTPIYDIMLLWFQPVAYLYSSYIFVVP